MARQRVTRRLAAIMAVDMVGYSRQMEADEEGTHLRISQLREELLDPAITENNGRTVKLTGDGVLVEFASVVDATRCALEIQRGMATRNETVPEAQRVLFRIGINLGDVIIEDDDIYGGGVNVAARLEGLADPGGVLVSGTAFDQAEGRIDCALEFVGEREVKNIERPVRVYRLLIDQAPVTSAEQHSRRSALKRYALAASAAVILSLSAAVLWIDPWSWFEEPSEIATPADLPTKPSIAVLPFDDQSEGAAAGFLADGITEDIITELSRNNDLFVIARNSTFVYKGKAVDIREVGETLNVKYVLEGSLREAGDRLQVTAQLIDSATNKHVWAERFDRERSQFFEIQSELVQTIVGTLLSRVRAEEAAAAFRKPTDSLRAYDLVKRGIQQKASLTKEGFVQAIVSLEQALQLDPDYATAHAHLGWAYWLVARRSEQEDDGRERALEMISHALELDPELAVAYQALVDILGEVSSRRADALGAAQKAVELDPNDAEGWILLANAFVRNGNYNDAVQAAEQALRLNPLAPVYYPYLLAEALYASGDYDAAISTSNQCRLRFPRHKFCYRYLVASLAQSGEIEEAESALDTLLDIQPDYSISYVRARPYFGDDELNERFVEDLRRAGLPD